jgi:hypothetical protein
LRPYLKLLLISAWNWGSWAFIKEHVPLPVIGQDSYGFNVYQSKPGYTGTFYSIWECVFFASLFLFIEKFILQLIGKLRYFYIYWMVALTKLYSLSNFISQVKKTKSPVPTSTMTNDFFL